MTDRQRTHGGPGGCGAAGTHAPWATVGAQGARRTTALAITPLLEGTPPPLPRERLTQVARAPPQRGFYHHHYHHNHENTECVAPTAPHPLQPQSTPTRTTPHALRRESTITPTRDRDSPRHIQSNLRLIRPTAGGEDGGKRVAVGLDPTLAHLRAGPGNGVAPIRSVPTSTHPPAPTRPALGKRWAPATRVACSSSSSRRPAQLLGPAAALHTSPRPAAAPHTSPGASCCTTYQPWGQLLPHTNPGAPAQPHRQPLRQPPSSQRRTQG